MDSFWVDMALSVIFSVLKQVIKNPGKKTDLKAAMLKLRNTINTVWAGDPDFD